MMKRGLQQREKKILSAAGLIKIVRKIFEKIPTKRSNTRGNDRKISLADSLSSALAMFGLKSPSLLAFDQARKNPNISHNLKMLYGIEQAPSDTYMREELDEVDPGGLRECFSDIFHEAQRGKALEPYRFLDGYLLSLDGTGLFQSDRINCDSCCEKNHKDGSKSYYHMALAGVIVHPDHQQVIPLCPELISKQDGAAKNDCENRASKRFFTALKKEHPRLKLTMISDALSANAPIINGIKADGHHFIINVKPGSNVFLFDWIDNLELNKVSMTVGKNKYTFCYINDIPLNDTKDAPRVNFIECKAIEVKGKTEQPLKTFTWVTDHEINNKNVFLIMRGGRARWKIENETFNTLKNQGYQFEHNFGHGNKHLFSVFASLMMLAFLIDQIQEVACGLFQAAREKMISRRALWEAMRSYFFICKIDSWIDLFTAITQSVGFSLKFDAT